MDRFFITETANELLANNMQISSIVGELNKIAGACNVVGLHGLANQLIGIIEAVNTVLNKSDEHLVLLGANDD